MSVGEDAIDEDLTLKDDVTGVSDVAAVQLTDKNQGEAKKDSSEILLEFLEVAVHQILYVRKVYPKEAFITRKKYNIPVHSSLHPGLNEYITSSLSSLSDLVKQDKISHLSVLIKHDSTPIENFLFEMKMIDKNKEVQDYVQLEQSLRSFLLQILSSSPAPPPSPQERNTFEVQIGCTVDCEVDLNIANDHGAMKWLATDSPRLEKKAGRLIPMKALTDSPILKLQLVVEHVTAS